MTIFVPKDDYEMVRTLKEKLSDWTDFDGAEAAVAMCFGILDEGVDSFFKAKRVFWSNNELGNLLYQMIIEMVNLGFLEQNEEGQFRWNKEFNWESKY